MFVMMLQIARPKWNAVLEKIRNERLSAIHDYLLKFSWNVEMNKFTKKQAIYLSPARVEIFCLLLPCTHKI